MTKTVTTKNLDMLTQTITAKEARRLIIERPVLSLDEVMDAIRQQCMRHNDEISFSSQQYVFTSELIEHMRHLGYVTELFTSKISGVTWVTFKW